MQHIRYALAELEETLDTQLLTLTHTNQRSSLSVPAEQLITSISAAVQSAKREMLKDIVNLSSVDSAKIYVETHLASLSSMLNVLQVQYQHASIQPKKRSSTDNTQLLLDLGSILEDMIEFIRVRFENQFPPNLVVPFTRVIKEQEKLGSLLDMISDSKAGEVDPALIAVINITITSQLNKGNTTFRQLAYFHDLLIAIISKPSTSEDSIIHIHKILTEYNFNDRSYIDYCTHGLANNCLHPIAEQFLPDTPENNIAKYSWYLMMIRQVPERKDTALHPDVNSVSYQMTNWIEQALKFLESVKISIPEQAAGQKVHTDVSVGILAIMLRLAVEGGLVKNVTKTDFIKAVAQFFTTSGADNLSFASLQSKFYNPEKVAVRKVIEIYQNFIRILNGWLSDPPRS